MDEFASITIIASSSVSPFHANGDTLLIILLFVMFCSILVATVFEDAAISVAAGVVLRPESAHPFRICWSRGRSRRIFGWSRGMRVKALVAKGAIASGVSNARHVGFALALTSVGSRSDKTCYDVALASQGLSHRHALHSRQNLPCYII